MKLRLSLTASILALTALSGFGAADAAAQRRAMVVLEQADSAAEVKSSANAVVARNGLRRVRADVRSIGVMTVEAPADRSFGRFARELTRDPDVVAVERDLQRELRYLPNDPALRVADPSYAGMVYQWNMLRQGLPAAWDQTRGDGVRVGVIDTGIDSTHPDLAGKVAVAVDQSRSAEGARDLIGHGTHVAGLACGAADNGFGMTGAGFNCQLIVEKTDLSSSSIVASVVDATRRGARVINMSFGGRGITLGERRALRYAIERDVVLVAAAADVPEVNQGHPAADLQPATTGPKLDQGYGLVVTAAGASGGRAFFAGRGSQISLAAYGYTDRTGAAGIFSSYPSSETQLDSGKTQPPSRPCQCRKTFEGSDAFGYLAGTSMAAPQVAGIAALVRSAAPRLPASTVIRIMKETASGQSWNTELGWGIVDAGAAVTQARAYAADTIAPQTTRVGARTRSSGRTIKLGWTGRDSAPAGVSPSGIGGYRLYIKRGRRMVSLGTTRSTKQLLRGKPGKRYVFALQARDRAGNLEPLDGAGDFRIRVRR